MPKGNPQYAVRLPEDQAERFEEYCDEKGISYAEALRRFTVRELDVEEGKQVRIAVQQSGNDDDEKENEVIADGGQVVRPMLQFMGAFYAVIGLTAFGIMAFSTFVYPADFILSMGMDLIGITFSSLLMVAVLMIILYTDHPEKVDRLLYAGVRKASRVKPAILGGVKS